MTTEYSLRFLHVNTGTGEARVEEVPLGGEILGPLDYGVKIHLERRSYEKPPLSSGNPLVLGRGVFSGSKLAGSHRLTFVFRSPVSRGLHASSLGGAAYAFMRTGLHGVVVEGWSEEPQVLVIDGHGSRLEAWLEELPWDRLWDIWRSGHRGVRGVKALALYLAERHSDTVASNGRVIAVGPAAARTIQAGVFSPGLKRTGNGYSLDPAAMDSASRGGGGSVMLRGHGLAAIVFGGSHNPVEENPRLGDLALLNSIAEKVAGKPLVKLVMEKTRKYRLDESLGVGGTFCVNYVHYRDLVPFMGYNSVYLSKMARIRILEEHLEKVWKPIAEELFPQKPGPRPWGTCGEPCPVACKKVWRNTKIDYEPGHAMGAFIGVYDPEETRRLIELVDELGLDAIEAGHIVAWLFDLMHRGMLHPEELGLDERPFFDPTRPPTPEESRQNARLAKAILEGLIDQENPILAAVASRGLRSAAAMLNLRYPGRVQMHRTGYQDPAVYAAYGDKGYMTPNYYWSPGVVAPMPVLGRYWTVYSPSFSEPEAFAEAALARAMAEYMIDNAGFCRFHRGWAEKLLEHLYREVWGVKVDAKEHARRRLAEIDNYQKLAGAEPRPWETRKTRDMVAGIAAETGHTEWAEKLLTHQGAMEWWTRFRRHLEKLLHGAPSGAQEPGTVRTAPKTR